MYSQLYKYPAKEFYRFLGSDVVAHLVFKTF